MCVLNVSLLFWYRLLCLCHWLRSKLWMGPILRIGKNIWIYIWQLPIWNFVWDKRKLQLLPLSPLVCRELLVKNGNTRTGCAWWWWNTPWRSVFDRAFRIMTMLRILWVRLVRSLRLLTKLKRVSIYHFLRRPNMMVLVVFMSIWWSLFTITTNSNL